MQLECLKSLIFVLGRIQLILTILFIQVEITHMLFKIRQFELRGVVTAVLLCSVSMHFTAQRLLMKHS